VDVAYQIARIVSMALFLYYGTVCLFSRTMVVEFERFGLARFRQLTGALEILGGLGLLVSYVVPDLVIVASSGLALLMVLGLAARLRVRDPLPQMLPALILLLVNLFLVAAHVAMYVPSSA
jgi:hypothetical protein